MKSIQILEPCMLCKPAKNQTEVRGILLPQQENKINCLKEVVKVSEAAKVRNIRIGDLVLTRTPKFQEVPVYLTANDEVPYNMDDVEKLEVVDPAMVIGIYREEESEK